jgi:VWFA-related protein
MRKLLLSTFLVLLSITIISTIRPSSDLRSAEKAQAGGASAGAAQADNPKSNAEKDAAKSGAKSPAKEAGKGGYQIKVDVSLVTTDVTIIGKVPSDLSEKDFIVYDDGVAQPASYFSLDQIPLAVAILVDASESTRPFTPVLRLAALSALQRLKPEDRVVLYQFNAYPQKLSDLTDDRLLIANLIERIQIALCTNINDTLSDAARYLARTAPRYRRAAILISDNEGTDSSTGMLNCQTRTNIRDARDDLLENSVTLFNIRAAVEDPMRPTNAARYLPWEVYDQEILQAVEMTGGEQYRVESAPFLQQALGDSINKLRKQYTVGFNPANADKPGVFHKLAIRFANPNRCPGCQIRSRSGYYSGMTASTFPPLTVSSMAVSGISADQIDDLLSKQIILSAGAMDFEFSAVPFNVDINPRPESKGRQLKVDLLIQFDQNDPAGKNNRHQCKMRVAVFYGTETGRLAGSQGADIAGELSEEKYQQMVKSGYPLSITIPSAGKKQVIKVVVYDSKTGNIGTQTVQYEVPK